MSTDQRIGAVSASENSQRFQRILKFLSVKNDAPTWVRVVNCPRVNSPPFFVRGAFCPGYFLSGVVFVRGIFCQGYHFLLGMFCQGFFVLGDTQCIFVRGKKFSWATFRWNLHKKNVFSWSSRLGFGPLMKKGTILDKKGVRLGRKKGVRLDKKFWLKKGANLGKKGVTMDNSREDWL